MFIQQTLKRFAHALNCVIATGIIAAIPTTILAQQFYIQTSGSSISMMAPGSFRNLMRPDYSRRDLKLMFEGMNIDQSQRYVLEILMEEYSNQFIAIVDEFKDVLDRYEWPRKSHFMPHFENSFGNIDNAEVIEFEGNGMQFVGLTGATIDIDLGDHQGVFITGEPGAGPGQGGTLHSIVMLSIDDSDDGEYPEHTIPPEVLEKLKENMRIRLEDLLAKHQTQLHELKEKQEQEIKDDVDKATAEEVAEAARKLRDEKALVAQIFQSDIKLLLSESQLNAWPATDRTLRRINTIRFGEFAGEKLDLVRFTADYPGKPGTDQELNSTLSQYKLQLDAALKDRNDYLSNSEIENFIAYSEEDNDEIIEIMQKESDLRVAVRSVNETYLQSVASLLNDEQAAGFHDKAKKEAYRTVYRTTRTQRLFDKASKLEDLDQTMVEAIETLSQRYLQELEIANDQLAESVHSEQPKQKMQMIEMIARMKANKGKFERPPTNHVMEGFQERNELGKRYINQLKQILSDEQFETISPKRQNFKHFFNAILDKDPK